eukprot:1851032-Pleurochrysis_carterae.AAC.1
MYAAGAEEAGPRAWLQCLRRAGRNAVFVHLCCAWMRGARARERSHLRALMFCKFILRITNAANRCEWLSIRDAQHFVCPLQHFVDAPSLQLCALAAGHVRWAKVRVHVSARRRSV